MKTSFLFLLLASFFVSTAYAQRIVEKPSYQFRNTGIYRINRIELSDQSTKVQIFSEFIPRWWVSFSQNTLFLEVPETGKKYPVLEIEGIRWDQQKPTPSSGVDTFTFIFPPLPQQTKVIDWTDGSTSISGISLTGESAVPSRLPAGYNGNWISTDGNNRWSYGLYNDFVIMKNGFWDYESVQQKGKNLIIRLTNGPQQSQLCLTLQKDGTCKIGPDKHRQLIYQPENFIAETSLYPDTLSGEQFFQPGSKAHIQGYIHGYNPKAGFTSGLVYCNNATTSEDFPTVVKVLPNGQFSADIPLDYPMINNIFFGRYSLDFYTEPGDTLTLYIDWEDWLLADRYRDRHFTDFRTIRFMGPLSKPNADLCKANVYIQPEGNIHFEKLARQLTPSAFKARALEMLDQKLHMLDTLSEKYRFAPKSKHLLEAGIKNNIAEYILDFDMTRNYFKEDKPNEILNVPVTAEYYDYLKQMPLNDPYMLVPYSSWAFFNRFEYASPFKSIYTHPGFQKGGLLEETALFWRLKDSIYSDYFGLEPTFCYEVIKLRDLSTQLKYSSSAGQADVLADIVLQGITHPYLRLKARQLTEEAKLRETRLSNPLPNTLNADIFRKLIAPYQGKVVFVDFWSTGCGPCRSGIKAMAPMREKFTGKDIVFLFITDEKSSPLKPYEDFMADVKGEKLRIPEDDYNYLRELFQFNGIPHYETINKKGEVVNMSAYKSLSQEEIFNKLLEE